MPDYLSPRTAGRGYKQNSPVVTSTGAADAGGLVGLDGNGKVDPSVLPDTGILSLPASEALAAGAFANVFNNAGTVSARLADNTNGREADGYVKVAVAAAGTAEIHTRDMNDGLTGLTLGADYYLAAAGGVTATRPTAATELDQYVGVAISATTIQVEIAQPVEL